MAVHNLSAEPLVVTKWQGMETFPKDGTVVELKFADGSEARAQWNDERLLVDRLPVDGTSKPEAWRPID